MLRNQYREDQPVEIRVQTSKSKLSVFITDYGGGQDIPDAETPDIEAKLEGEQSPRGWGLFLIKNMVDDVLVTTDERHHTGGGIPDLGDARGGRGHGRRLRIVAGSRQAEAAVTDLRHRHPAGGRGHRRHGRRG